MADLGKTLIFLGLLILVVGGVFLAGGKIFLTREDGTTFVLQQGDSFKLLAKNELAGEHAVATPVFVDDRILLRTYDHLYCIGR